MLAHEGAPAAHLLAERLDLRQRAVAAWHRSTRAGAYRRRRWYAITRQILALEQWQRLRSVLVCNRDLVALLNVDERA